MDANRFDRLARRLAAARLTRARALRGIAAGAAALAGLGASTGDVSAGRKRKLCHCGDDPTAQCTDEKVSKKARKQHLRDHPCDYKGECRGTGTRNPCQGAGVAITVDVDLLGDACTVGGTACGDPNETGLECVINVCLPIDLGDACDEDADCGSGRCEDGQCADCPELARCGTGPDRQCCVVDADCVLGLCVLRGFPR